MPDFCASFGCSNERNARTRRQGITFHRFPKDKVKRQMWTDALRRRDFQPNDYSIVCSRHFKPEDFDRTGQTIRLREGAIPSIFSFSRPRSKVRKSSKPNETSQEAAAEPPAVSVPLPQNLEELGSDHHYALDSDTVKQKLIDAQKKVEELQKELRNARDRDRRHKKMVTSLQEDLKSKNVLAEELQQKLDSYSGLPVELFKQHHAFTPTQKDFALALHLHGPKAYKYLRDSKTIPLPHPHTLQKWSQPQRAESDVAPSLLDVLLQENEQEAVECSIATELLGENPAGIE